MYKTLEDVERVISSRKNENVIDMFVGSYLQGVEYEAWIETKKAEHETLYPKQIDGEAVLDEDGVTVLYYEQIPNPYYIEFDTWMQETEQVQVGTKNIIGEDGITVTGSEPIYEDRTIRTYTEVLVDVEAWKATSELWKNHLDKVKDETLDRLTVTTTSGKVFYADPSSRSDLVQAVILGQLHNITETTWKLAEEFNGQRIILVTIDELAEASYLALQSKGQIVGAI